MKMLRVNLSFLLAAMVASVVAAATPHDRAAALVKRMSLAEKVAQMQDRAPAIPRLGIPAYGWWNEALHGVARNGLATVFPQAIGRAATWDTDLEFRIADAISTEARAKFNGTGDTADHDRYGGLTFWSPNINIFRDPRWGRGQETFGEDPYLTAQIAQQFIRGMQGPDPNYFKTVATSKHFAVHSGPETGRHEFNARVTEKDLEYTYLPAFRATLSGTGAYSVMCAYNRVDGTPACANSDLLQTRLRGDWGFQGYVVSDCGAVGDIYTGHHFVHSMAEAAAKAVKAGTDLDCGTEYQHLTEAVNKGLITEAEIDRSVTRLMEARIKLGLFDPNDRYEKIGADQVASKAHAQLALEAAEKSMVLLKNDGLLPWTEAPKKLAVIGPAAGRSGHAAGQLLRHASTHRDASCGNSAAVRKEHASARRLGQCLCRRHDCAGSRSQLARWLGRKIFRIARCVGIADPEPDRRPALLSLGHAGTGYSAGSAECSILGFLDRQAEAFVRGRVPAWLGSPRVRQLSRPGGEPSTFRR